MIMKARTARLYFLGLTVALAAMLLLKWITPLVSGILFASGLVIFGLLSNGFRRK